MEENVRARAIIPYQGGLVLIHRIKQEEGNKREYYVFPGGGVEENENLTDCVMREVREELGIEVVPLRELYRTNGYNGLQVFFLCEYISGIIGTGCGPEFNSSEYKKHGQYLPLILPLTDIPNTNIYPTEIRDALVVDIQKYQGINNIKCGE